jgi:hypothetical protein
VEHENRGSRVTSKRIKSWASQGANIIQHPVAAKIVAGTRNENADIKHRQLSSNVDNISGKKIHVYVSTGSAPEKI